MPYRVEFEADKNLISTYYEGDISLEDIESATSQSLQLLKSREETLCYILTDFSAVETIPDQLFKIWQYAQKPAHQPNLAAWLVAGASKPILYYLVRVIVQLGSLEYHVFKSREDALAYLKSKDDQGLDNPL